MSKSHLKPLILVDGSSYLYRAFHALPPLTTSRGEPTGAVYGVLSMLRRLLEEFEPEYIAVVFDARGKTFRDELYAQYKANRPAMPDELTVQIEPLRGAVRALGLPLLEIPGVEADDVIGTLARQAAESGSDVVISTSDKDLAQLVEPHITLVNTMSGTVLDEEGVRSKFGVSPGQIVDFLALVGDPSDNIPGVPKVGPKTAAKWLQTHGTLEQLVANANEIKGKVGDNLRACLDQLSLSRQLATIRCDVELDISADQLQRSPPSLDALRDLYQRFEFKTLLAQLGEGQHPENRKGTPDQAETTLYETITSVDRLQEWLARLKKAPLFAFDTETTDLNYMRAELVGLSFAITPGEAAYVPLRHLDPAHPEQLKVEYVLEAMRGLLENPAIPKLGQNLKYDMSVLARVGLKLRGIQHDTMLQSYVLDSTATRHDLDSLALKYLGYRTMHFEDVAGKGTKQLRFDQVPVVSAARYAAEDADVTLRLHQALWPRLEREERLAKLYSETEIRLIPVLSCMERNGVLIDKTLLAQQSRTLTQRMREIEDEAYRVAGERFNLGSPKQIQGILYERLKLPVLQKTPKGQPSTAESVLQELANTFPLPRLILEHRGLSKLKSTYTDRLPEQINPETGRVHTSYHQAVAATGRLSSSDPNLQNIPVRTEEGRRIRQAFIASPGHKIVAADYSQIELRIMAHLSGDQGLCKAFRRGEDIHRATAGEIFDIAPEGVSAEQRRSAKAINFGLIYGMSPFGLAKQLGIERSAAQDYVDRYFARYPRVKAFMEETRARAREAGYVETVFGRRLYLPEINSRNAQRRQYAERTAINAPMQGTAADIIKRAMIRVHDWLEGQGAAARMIMQVHDELVFEIAKADLDLCISAIRQAMMEAADLSIALVVDVGIGSNWDKAH